MSQVVQINELTKDELIRILINQGFIISPEDKNKFIKDEQVNTGKAIINGREILKTENIKLVIEYISETTISDNNKVVNGHQLKLIINDNELEFVVNNKNDLQEFFGFKLSDKTNKVNTKIVEDIQ